MRKSPTENLPFARVSAAALLGAALLALGTLPIGASEKAAGQQMATAEPIAADAATEVVHHEDGVAAVVNDIPITDYELRQRIALAVSTSGMQPSPEALKKIRAQILTQIEDEHLQLAEAQRKNITVSPVEVDKEIENIIKENNLTMDQLKGILSKAGVVMATLRSQITAQLAWRKAVEDEYQDRVDITPSDIDDELARITEGSHKPHYLVSEIFLAIDTPDQEEKVQKDAQNLESQLQTGAPFQSIARQFSQSPSAASGGDVGLVYEGQLAPELNSALEKLTPGSISEPIRSTGGYYILALRQRLEPVGTKTADPAPDPKAPPPGELPLARLLLPLPPKVPQAYVENVMKVAANVRQQVSNCAQLPKVAEEIKGGAQYMNLGMMKLTDLSAQMQGELAKTEPGTATAPFLSPAGVELIMRCDKAVVKSVNIQIPTRKEIEEQLFTQQISVLARRYIRDLRRSADVETR